MAPKDAPWATVISLRLLMGFLRLYPKTYRQRYRLEMLRTFGDCCRAAVQQGGNVGLIRLWVSTLADVCVSAAAKHLDEGLLVTGGLAIRRVSLVMIAAAVAIFALAQGVILGAILLATGLLIVGALGLFVTSPEGQSAIRQKVSEAESGFDLYAEIELGQPDSATHAANVDIKRGFLLQWVAASGLGLVIGLAVFGALVTGFDTRSDIGVQTAVTVVGGIILGTSIGIAQATVLQKHAARFDRWVITSSLGVAMGAVMGLILFHHTGGLGGYHGALVIGSSVVGESLGAAQWLVLRRYVTRAGWWVIANSIGFLVAWGLSVVLGQVLYLGVSNLLAESFATFLSLILAGFLLLFSYGSITGSVLIWLLKRPLKQDLTPVPPETEHAGNRSSVRMRTIQ